MMEFYEELERFGIYLSDINEMCTTGSVRKGKFKTLPLFWFSKVYKSKKFELAKLKFLLGENNIIYVATQYRVIGHIRACFKQKEDRDLIGVEFIPNFLINAKNHQSSTSFNSGISIQIFCPGKLPSISDVYGSIKALLEEYKKEYSI